MSTPLKNVNERMKGIESFKMAWIDASTDDVSDEYNLDNIPKLYLMSNVNGVHTKVEMTIIPSEENTMKFIHDNAQFKFDMPAELVKEEDKKDDKKDAEKKEEERKS